LIAVKPLMALSPFSELTSSEAANSSLPVSIGAVQAEPAASMLLAAQHANHRGDAER
jgi:hydroxyethylthiazole kinase-like sugar kinase family protein